MDAHWKYLETHADREDVQAEIRNEIRRGTIRAVPGPGGIRIIPQVWELGHEKQAIFRPNRLEVKSAQGVDG